MFLAGKCQFCSTVMSNNDQDRSMQFNHDVGEIMEKLNHMMIGTQYESAASYIESLLNDKIGFIEANDILYLRGIRCYCLYLSKEYRRAIDTVLVLLQERESRGNLNLLYLRDIRTLALSRRGLCEFEECLSILNSVYNQLVKIKDPPEDFIQLSSTIQKDIEDTYKILNNDPVAPDVILGMAGINGPFGVQTLDVDDIEIPKGNTDLICLVKYLNIVVLNPYEIEIEFDFTLNNQHEIESWVSIEKNTAPPLFIFLLQRGGKVYNGQFDLKFKNYSSRRFHPHAFLRNGFSTIIHPGGYHPRSMHPIPECKKFRYIKSDCSAFFSPIPKEAQVHFKGKIMFSPPDGYSNKNIFRNFLILFPFGSVAIARPVITTGAGSVYEPETISLKNVEFLQDQDGFQAGKTTIDLPQQTNPLVGPASLVSDTDHWIYMSDMNFLSIEMNLKPLKNIVASFLISSEVIPIGIFNHIPGINLRNDPETESQSTFDLSGDYTKYNLVRRPVATLILENYSQSPCSFNVIIESDLLELREQHSVPIPPGQRKSIPVSPVINPDTRLFAQWQSNADFSQTIRNCPIKVSVYNELLEKDNTFKEIISKTYFTNILPPDFMVWAISELNDGSKLDLRLLIAKWVMPGARCIKQLCAECSFSENSVNPIEDFRRIYNRIAALQIEYDMERIAWGSEMEYLYQRVRLPSVVLSGRKMNCIDGCVLFASCFELLGYETMIIFIKTHDNEGHAFLGILDPKNAEQALFIETTIACVVPGKKQNSFDDATYTGLKLVEDNKEYLFENNGDRKSPPGEDPYYPFHRVISIRTARELGITPFEDKEIRSP